MSVIQQSAFLSSSERQECLKTLLIKNKRLLFVYEQSQDEGTGYNYKDYLNNLILYTTSVNELFEGQLTTIKVNFYSVASKELSKQEIKSLVHENSAIIKKLIEVSGEG